MVSSLGATLIAAAVLVPVAGCSSDSSPSNPPPQGLNSAALDAGLRVTLTAQQATPGAAQVTFRATVADDDGSGPGYTVDFGDGKTDSKPATAAACDTKRSTATPLATTITLRHRYAKPGTYAVSLLVTSGTACPLPATETQTALTLVSVAKA